MSLLEEFGLNGYLPDMSAPRYTEELIPIKEIVNGIIITKDNRYLRILEISPTNFESKSFVERDDLINDFKSWLKIAPINIQIKIITKQTDPTEIVQSILSRCQKENDEDIENLLKHYTNLIYNLSNKDAVTKKFYMIISYEGRNNPKRNPTFEDIEDEINYTINIIQSNFARMDNMVTPLGDEADPKWPVLEFLYSIFNPRTNRREFGKPEQTLSDRINRLYSDNLKISSNNTHAPSIDSIVSPLSVDVNYSDIVILDGLYHTYLLVAGDGYPIYTVAGWFNGCFSLGPGETVDVFIHKEPTDQFVRTVAQKMKFNTIKLGEKNEMQADYEKTSKALNAASYMKDAMNNGGEIPFYMTTLITLTGYSYEYLMKRKNQIMDYYRSRDMHVYALKNIQEEAMKSSFPFLSLSPKLYFKGKRNILSSGLASCYPFISADMNDKDGILMGLDSSNSTMCILNPFNRKAYKNANMVILGTSGAGKTYTEQLMALRMRAKGTQCFILAPDKAHEFKRACTLGVNGEFIKIASSSTDHINIMDIRPTNSEASEILQGDAAENTVYVSNKANSIITFISLLIPDLTNEEEQIIDTCIIETYEKYGITDDNDSIYLDPNDKEKGLKKMPILEDLYDNLINSGVHDRIIRILSQFITGSAKSFNKRTNVNLDNKYIVFDLSGLQGRLQPAGMFIALDFIVGRIREDVTEEKMVFIDEGWQLIGSGANEKAAEYVKWLFKIIRGYNGGACIATQDIKDFFSLKGGEYGNAILSNSQIKMLLNLSPNEAEFVQEELKLTRSEIRDIKNYKKGQCLICANSNHIPVRIIGSDYETELITTDPDQVKKVIEKMKNNGGTID